MHLEIIAHIKVKCNIYTVTYKNRFVSKMTCNLNCIVTAIYFLKLS